MANLITTKRTYATMGNALAALDRAADKMNVQRDYFRYMVAIAADGRYAPTVLLGSKDMHLALPLVNMGIMVVS